MHVFKFRSNNGQKAFNVLFDSAHSDDHLRCLILPGKRKKLKTNPNTNVLNNFNGRKQ